jgi:hypothetical protein
MKWRKLGKIFDPDTHGLPAGCVGWAQSPQPLVLEDRVRIYFSTRMLDPVAEGKYLSHVAYVDMTKDLETVLGVADEPVIDLGALGTFDEHGIFPMDVVPVGDALYGYTTGWSRRVSVSVETGIGLAVSRDGGRSFERAGDGPVLSATMHEPFLVGDGHVRRVGDRFHMWYIFGTDWKRYAPDREPDRTYRIGHAESADGIHWTKEDEGRRIVADVLGEEECQALPSVVEIDGRHHMVFCFRHSYDFRTNPERGYRIGHAWSEDLRTWTRDDATLTVQPTAGDWDSDMLCYPSVFACDGRVYLLYNGNAFGRHGFGAAILER